MKDQQRDKFEEWWAKAYLENSSRKKVAKAAWNAAWHLMSKMAREEGRKVSEEARGKAARAQALYEMALKEIDDLEASHTWTFDGSVCRVNRQEGRFTVRPDSHEHLMGGTDVWHVGFTTFRPGRSPRYPEVGDRVQVVVGPASTIVSVRLTS